MQYLFMFTCSCSRVQEESLANSISHIVLISLWGGGFTVFNFLLPHAACTPCSHSMSEQLVWHTSNYNPYTEILTRECDCETVGWVLHVANVSWLPMDCWLCSWLYHSCSLVVVVHSLNWFVGGGFIVFNFLLPHEACTPFVAHAAIVQFISE